MRFKGYFVFVVVVITLLSCHSKKVIVDNKRPSGNKSPKHLLEKLKANEFQCKTLSIKSSVYINIGGNSNSFKAYLRLRKDSTIWVSITSILGIEMSRILITRDSVWLMNRPESTYFVGNFDYLSSFFNADIDFDFIQSLLLGNNIGISEVDKLKSSIDHGQFLLSSCKKRKLKKALDKPEKAYDIIYSNWINQNDYRISKFLISDFIKNQSLFAEFNDYKKIGIGLLPHSIVVKIKSDKNLELKVSYSKVNIDKQLTYPFNIPSKYTQINENRKSN